MLEMSVRPENLSILHYPADALRKKALPVEKIDDEARAIAQRMLDLMFEAEGIGLAAPQVGLGIRLFVADVPATVDGARSPDDVPPTATSRPLIFWNPRIERFIGPIEPFEEGCLSLPEIRGEVLRPPEVIVRALDENGEEFTLHAAGLLARCIQHELDHLDGVLIIDRFMPTSRLRNRAAVRDLEREAGRR
jgi:peptide deformylase